MAHTDNNETLWLKNALEDLSGDFTTLENALKAVLTIAENGDGSNDLGEIESVARLALQAVSMDDEFEQARLRVLNKL